MSVTSNTAVVECGQECDTSFNEPEGLVENDVEKISVCSIGSLLEYIQNLSTSADHQDINFDYVESILLKGVGINDTCKVGQSVMHEVAANWDTEVADFFFKKGAIVTLKDNNGRTPLHMAASSNHVKMIEWLINHEVDIEAETFQEQQTPFHYAARYNSVEALELLYDKGGNQDVQDYQGRTPLHLAAELDRTHAAESLVNLPEPAEVRVQDYQGNIAICNMTRTMPNVVSSALDQLYRVSSPSRKQYFILSHLEPAIENHGKGVKTPFEVAVEEKHRQVLSHKVMQALISEKWKYIRLLFYPHLVFDIVFTLIWSVLIAYPSVQQKHNYALPQDSWRVIVGVIGLLLYFIKVVIQALEIIRSTYKHLIWVRSHGQTIRDDLAIPTQTEDEKIYLQNKLSDLSKSWPIFFRDPWNLCTTLTNVLLLLFIILHFADVANHSTVLATWVARISCLVCLSMWLCLLKQARGFRALGALIAIVGELFGDIFRFFLLFALVFIPYFISFWVMFGGDQSTSLSDENREDLISFYRVVIMVFRMSLIDDYPYSSMRDLDEAMATILVTTVLLFLAVVALNLFIALLSDTFQRVYDNAQANSLLEQCRLIHFYEETLPTKMHTLYLKHIHTHCNPLEKYYDDDDNEGDDRPAELKKIAHQINDKIVEFTENKSSEVVETCDDISNKIDGIELKIEEMSHQLEAIQIILENSAQAQTVETSRPFPTQPLAGFHPNQPLPHLPQPPSMREKRKMSKPDSAKKKVMSVVRLQASDLDGHSKVSPPRKEPHHSHHSVRSRAVGRAKQQQNTLTSEHSVGELIPTHRRIKKNSKELEEEFLWEKKLRPYSKTAWRIRNIQD